MKIYTMSQAAEALGLSTETLRKYKNECVLVPLKGAGNRVFYTEQMLEDFLRGKYSFENQDIYTVVQSEPLVLSVNITKMVKIESISTENISYYQIPIENYNIKSDFNVLQVENMKDISTITYTLGKVYKDGENEFFEPAISWSSKGI